MNFNSWKLNLNLKKEEEDKLLEILINICKLPIFNNVSYLLNRNQLNNILEQYIFELCQHQLSEENIAFDENIYIEFWFKNNFDYDKTVNYIHIDKDEYEKTILKKNIEDSARPFLSTVVYLNDNDFIPTVVTKIEDSSIKNNNFDEKELIFSFPRKNTMISFNGGKYYHGHFHINVTDKNFSKERYVLVMNLWNKRPLKIPYFSYDICFYNYSSVYKKEIPIIFISDGGNESTTYFSNGKIVCFNKNEKTINVNGVNLITENFLRSLILDKRINEKLFIEFNKAISEKINEFEVFFFKETTVSLKKTELDMTSEKFKQRFIYNNYYSKELCNWIIYEAEKYAEENGGWTTNRHDNYPTTDLQINKITSVNNFIFYSLKESIIYKIIEDYNLTYKNIELNLRDAFIVKYEFDKQSYLEMHDDYSSITANIMLSEKSDFEGGGILFEDELKINLNKGDMILHSGKFKHSGVKITKGKRYVLVFFIKIFIES